MPLTSAQFEFVQGSIEHFFYNLPRDKTKLCDEIVRIEKAFKHTLDQKDPDYALLQDCIQNPSQFLKRLESLHKTPIKLGDIRNAILTIANTQITTAASDAKLVLETKFWDKNNLEKKIAEAKDNNEVYQVTKSQTPHGPDPYQVPSVEGRYYSAWTYPDEKTLTANVRVEINIPPIAPKNISVIIEELPAFRDDDDQDYYFTQAIVPNAQAEIDDKVMQHILNYLLDHNYITLEQLEQLDCTKPSINLILYKLYVDMIIARKIHLCELWTLENSTIKLLQEPVIIKLIEAGKESIESLKNLTLTQEHLQVISHPHYYQKILKGELKIVNVVSLDKNTCKNMIYPPALYLHSKKILSENQIKEMKTSTRKIIADDYYLNQLSKGHLEYKAINDLDEKQADTYTLSFVTKSLSDGFITVKELSNTNSNAMIIFKNQPAARYLISEGMISLSDLSNVVQDRDDDQPLEEYHLGKALTAEQKKLFKPVLQEFLKLATAGLVSEFDITHLYSSFLQQVADNRDIKESSSCITKNFHHRSTAVAMNRLKLIFNDKPLQLPDHKIDNPQSVKSSCEAFQIPFNDVREIAISDYIKDVFCNNKYKNMAELFSIGRSVFLTEFEIAAHAIARRLIGLFAKKPYRINNESDSLTLLHAFVTELSSQIKCKSIDLYDAAIKLFLNNLRYRIDPIKTGKSRPHQEILTALLSNNDSKSPNSSIETLQKIIPIAKLDMEKFKEQKKSEPPFCSPRRFFNSPSQAYDLCKKLSDFSELLIKINQNPSSSMSSLGLSNRSLT